MKTVTISIITALALTACGGGSSTPVAVTEPVEAVAPISPITVPTVCPVPIVCEVCPVIEPVEPEIATFYLISTATRDGDNIQERVYDEQGYLLSDYNELKDIWYKYAYDENHNKTSFTIESNGVVTSYTYSTYDENSNQLTSTSSSGRAWIAEYDTNNHRIRLEIDYNGDGIYVVELYTYVGDNQVKIEKLDENRTENRRFDINDNLIYSDIVINGEIVQVETYTWQEFTEEL